MQEETGRSARNDSVKIACHQRKLGPFRLGWRRWGDLCINRKLREAGGVLHRDVREDFAVERDACGFQAVNQLAVGQAVQPRGGADALDPQAAILALLGAAVAESIAIGAIGRFLGGLIQLALGEEKAFGPLEILLAPSPALGAAFYACHGFLLFLGKQDRLREREKHAYSNGFVSEWCVCSVRLAASTFS